MAEEGVLFRNHHPREACRRRDAAADQAGVQEGVQNRRHGGESHKQESKLVDSRAVDQACVSTADAADGEPAGAEDLVD
eukprot:4294960-Prymnesium_polylepis.1